MEMLREMAHAMWEHAAIANRMMEQMERRFEENLEGHVGRAKVDLEYLKFAEFYKVNPPGFRQTFNKLSTLIELRNWSRL